MRTLVIGGKGRLGAAVTQALRAAGHEAVPASRSAGDDGVALDLMDVDGVAAAARGFDVALVSTPLGEHETQLGLNALAGLRKAGVAKAVYVGIHNLEALAEIPHFAAKIPVKKEALGAGRNVVLEPNFFFQNDFFFFDAIRFGGVYPLPVGHKGIYSVDIEDIAAAAVNALTRSDWDGKAVPICGPERLTGPVLAANWAEALGRPVVYPGDDIAPFVAGLERALPLDDWMRRDTEIMMRVTQELGCLATEADHAATRAILGRPPRAHAAFARAVAHEQQA